MLKEQPTGQLSDYNSSNFKMRSTECLEVIFKIRNLTINSIIIRNQECHINY